jgi:hypothetical protein
VNALNQQDGVHPTEAGQRRMAETVWRALKPVLEGRERREGREGRARGESEKDGTAGDVSSRAQ